MKRIFYVTGPNFYPVISDKYNNIPVDLHVKQRLCRKDADRLMCRNT